MLAFTSIRKNNADGKINNVIVNDNDDDGDDDDDDDDDDDKHKNNDNSNYFNHNNCYDFGTSV